MISQPEAMKQKLAHEAQQTEAAAAPATNFVSRKQLRARLDAAAADHDSQQEQEHQKRMFVERNDGIDFWRDTAMFWHRQAVQRMNALDSTRHEVAGLTREIKLRGIERDHYQAEAAQCHADTMAAERRSDAYSDILDALAQGYPIAPFAGRATWWRQDTDTLTQIAKAAREWQDRQDEKPPVYMGHGEGEPFTMGGQEFRPENDPMAGVLDPKAEHELREQMIAKIARAYSMGMPMPTTPLHQAALLDLMREFELATRFICETEARIERERQAQAERTATVDEPRNNAAE